MARLIIFALLSVPCIGQLWSGIIDASRAVDWSNSGVRGGIPTRATICATLNSGATAAQINAAIAQCTSGHVVFLNAGIYNLTAGLVAKSNVTLRGAGPDQTFIRFATSNGCGGESADICVGGPNLYWAGSPDILPGGTHARKWIGGYSKGTTQISVDSARGLSRGTIIVLDQANDTSDNGQFTVCDSNTASPRCSLEGGAPGRSINGVTHSQQQYVQITAIKGTRLTILPGLYASNWSASKSPGIFWTNPITGFGIEDLSMDHTNSDGYAGVSFVNADSCWVKNIRSIYLNNERRANGRNHIWLYLSSHVTIQDSYIFGTAKAAALSYGIESFLTGDDLIQNNIFQHIYSSLMVGSSVGVVTAYNYGIDFFDGVGVRSMSPFVQVHDAGNMFLLYEGLVGNEVRADVFHGSGNADTVFRSYLSGYEPGKTGGTIPVNFLSFNRYMNIIGNVLGTSGVQTMYESYAPHAFNQSTIYSLGFGNIGRAITVSGDPLVRLTLMRWGNYDTVNNAVRWSVSEVPSGLRQYANAVPANQTLPASFYLSGKPSFWGTMPWPAIGPDVAGGTGPAGHAYAIPAQLCYTNSPVDKSYGGNNVLLFNANVCYSRSPLASPPTRRKALVY